jgi:hypothetical protein
MHEQQPTDTGENRPCIDKQFVDEVLGGKLLNGDPLTTEDKAIIAGLAMKLLNPAVGLDEEKAVTAAAKKRTKNVEEANTTQVPQSGDANPKEVYGID